jgi:hypothetical protein
MKAKSDSSVSTARATLPCPKCGGKGKTHEGFCNCGSGEGCTMHSDTALSLWGHKCDLCKGSGKVNKSTRDGFRWR